MSSMPHHGEEPSPRPRPIVFRGLPEPILPARPHLVSLYAAASEFAKRADEQIRSSRLGKLSQWEVCHSALWARHIPPRESVLPAPMELLDQLYGGRTKDGMIPSAISCTGCAAKDNEMVPPPILAWAELEWFGVTGDLVRIARVVPLLEGHTDWIFAQRSAGNGALVFGRGPRNARGSIAATAAAAHHCQCLASLALLVGEDDIARKNSLRYLELKHIANDSMWDDARGVYSDIDEDDYWAEPVRAGMYWALLADIPTPERRATMVHHLRSYRDFARNHMVPSLAAREKGFSPNGEPYSGGVWPSTVHMVARGLEFAGEDLLAHHIALNHLENVAEVHRETGKFWEYYAPDHAAPGVDAKPISFGWTALSVVALLLENVLGISINGPAGEVTWNLLLEDETHGVRNLRVGKSDVELYASRSEGMWMAKVRSDGPVTVHIKGRSVLRTVTLDEAGSQATRLS